MNPNVTKLRFFLEWVRFTPYRELSLSYFIFTAAAGLFWVGWLGLGHTSRRLLLAIGCVLAASLYSVLAPGKPFGHYLLFLLFPLAFLSAFVLATLHETHLGRTGRLLLIPACLAVAVAVATIR
jgi:hypothetical protein